MLPERLLACIAAKLSQKPFRQSEDLAQLAVSVYNISVSNQLSILSLGKNGKLLSIMSDISDRA